MSLRIVIVCLLGLLGACSAGSDDLPAAEADSGSLCAQTLQFSGGAEKGILPNVDKTIEVQFKDLLGGSVAGVTIEFALTGSAQGASLSPASAVTDASGVARTQLRVGSTTGELQVRARTSCGLSAYATVMVGEALGAQLAVSVQYAGRRQVSAYTVTALPGMSCAAALDSGLAGEVSFTFPATSTAPVQFELGSGTSAAIVGFGRDATGAKLALGCKEYKAPITADQSAAKNALLLTLDNQALSLDDELQLNLKLDLQGAAQRLSATAASAVSGTLGAASNAEGDYYLDAVLGALTQQNDLSASAALTNLRSGGALASSLSSALEKAAVGPRAVGARVGKLLAERGAELTMSSSYRAGALGPITALGALSSDGTQSLDLVGQPTATLGATFSSDLAQLAVSSLRISLPLGDYGVSLLQALQTESAAPNTSKPMPASIAAAAGCSAFFGPWWSKSTAASVCDASVAVTACESALSTLLARISSDLQTLNTASPSIVLSGTVQAEDRSDDGQIDDLGPTDVAGTWGPDAVALDVSVPVRTAFAR
ncbi:MAG: hypothetical protein JWN48_6104 [Myxococcaceae bacterium]|nr:hypothetical protein [Myxococcaceae bacterium]